MTSSRGALLGIGMAKPWKLRIDWLLQEAYGDPVEVWLYVMDSRPRRLRTFSTVPRAIDWALRYIADRGAQPKVVKIPTEGDTYVYLHAGPDLPKGLAPGRSTVG